VLLCGERGTGKTFLARYYHERRQERRPRPPAGLKPRPEKKVPPGVWLPLQAGKNSLVTVTLSEFADLETLRDTLFGWAERSWNLAEEPYDGLLGEAHGGTLFLDEIHHLDRSLQASLLGPLNNRRYRPKMATYELASSFDLVVATNDPGWRSKLADDFRDRIERIVLEVPAFRTFQRQNPDALWSFWDCTLRQRCGDSGITFTEQGEWPECRDELQGLFRRHPLRGNWRDLQRLADNLLLALTADRDGQVPELHWSRRQLELAIEDTFGNL
jgi:transcriptional regulator with AAA-type ATPase domain